MYALQTFIVEEATVRNTRRSPSKDSVPNPLRANASTADPSDMQEEYLGAFIAACVIGYVGVYVSRYQNSGGIKLRLYNDGESYEDILNASEEWGVLFDDYARTVGVRPHYLSIVKRVHAARLAVRDAEAAQQAPPAEEAAPERSEGLSPPGKPLRAK